jgi:predicted exporter
MKKICFLATFVAMVFVASWKRSVHALLPSVFDLGCG